MPTSFKEIAVIFLFLSLMMGFFAFPAFWYFADLETAIWAAPALSGWQTFHFMLLMYSFEKLEESNITFKNFWWVWAATKVSLDYDPNCDLNEVDIWCKEELEGKWERLNGLIFAFFRKSDATAFKLRWYE